MELRHTILIEIATLYTYYATKLRIIFESTKKKANFCVLLHLQHSILALPVLRDFMLVTFGGLSLAQTAASMGYAVLMMNQNAHWESSYP